MIGFLPYYISKVWWPKYQFKECTGVIGDTIGGITGPVISALSAILVYIAFKEQVKANKLVQNHFIFESIYAELDSLEEYADELEEKLYSREVGENGKWNLSSRDTDSITPRAWTNRIGVAKVMFENARLTNNEVLPDRVKSFAVDGFKPLIVQLNSKIPDRIDGNTMYAWRDAYENYFK